MMYLKCHRRWRVACLSGETVFMPSSDKLARGTARRDRCGRAVGMQKVHASGRLMLCERDQEEEAASDSHV